MAWNLDLQAGYVGAVIPILTALVAVPTLQEVARGELLWLRPVLITPLELGRNIRQFVLTERGLHEGHWWTILSHVFLHEDFDHLLANTQGVLTSGLQAFAQLGHCGLYGVFFCGSSASALNKWGRACQTEAQLVGAIPRAPGKVGFIPVPESVQNVWNDVREGARRAAPVLHSKVESYGASGGVCGLMGYGFGSIIFQMAQAFIDPTSNNDEEETRLLNDIFPNALTMIINCLNLWQSGQFLVKEWRCLRGEDGLTGIDHSGHLTGFAVGSVAALIARLCGLVSKDDPRGPRNRRPGSGRSFSFHPHGSRNRYINASGEVVHD